jgi:F420H(2)-dependent quinone reductase
MKILLKVVGVIVACVIVALVVLSIIGLDPKQRRPGLWLKGDVQNFPADWTFADKYQTIMVETHPWYLIPHSVNIFFISSQGNLYLHADYDPGGTFPSAKSWTASVARNPVVRLKLGNRVFDAKAYLVTDKAEADALFEVQRKKYPKSPYSDYRRRGDVYFLRVLPG